MVNSLGYELADLLHGDLGAARDFNPNEKEYLPDETEFKAILGNLVRLSQNKKEAWGYLM